MSLPAIYSLSREEKFSICKSKTFEQTLRETTIAENICEYSFCHFTLNDRVKVYVIMRFPAKMIKYELICLKL